MYNANDIDFYQYIIGGLFMSVHIEAKQGEIAESILLPGIHYVQNISLKHF